MTYNLSLFAEAKAAAAAGTNLAQALLRFPETVSVIDLPVFFTNVVPENSTVEVDVNVDKVSLVMVKATLPVDISLTSSGGDVFLGQFSVFTVLTFYEPVTIDHFKLRATAAPSPAPAVLPPCWPDAFVEVLLGGHKP